MKIFFFSFSYKGKNQGCCVVKSICPMTAIEDTYAYNIHPKNDHISMYQVKDTAGLEFNRLYSSEEMNANPNYERYGTT